MDNDLPLPLSCPRNVRTFVRRHSRTDDPANLHASPGYSGKPSKTAGALLCKPVAVFISSSVVCPERRTARDFNKTERVSLARTISTGSKLARLCPDYAVLKQRRGLRGIVLAE